MRCTVLFLVAMSKEHEDKYTGSNYLEYLWDQNGTVFTKYYLCNKARNHGKHLDKVTAKKRKYTCFNSAK